MDPSCREDGGEYANEEWANQTTEKDRLVAVREWTGKTLRLLCGRNILVNQLQTKQRKMVSVEQRGRVYRP